MSQDTTAAPLLDRLLHHAVVIITDGDSYRMRTSEEVAPHPDPPGPGGEFHLTTSGEFHLAIDSPTTR